MRLRRLLPLFAVLVAGAGCRVDTEVLVDVAEDGSGTVTVVVELDGEAVGHLPDLDGDGTTGPADLAALVRADDLTDAGWAVADPEPTGEGGLSLQASKPFGSADEAATVLSEVTGPDGPLRDARIDRSTGFGKTRLTFSGVADLSAGIEVFGDEALAAALEGEPLGEDQADIERRFGAPVEELFGFVVRVSLPGRVDGNGNGDDGTTWVVVPEGPTVALHASGLRRDPGALTLVGIGVTSALALVGVVVGRAVRGRSRAVAPRP